MLSVPAAEVGGVGGPVAGAGSLPCDGNTDVDPQQAGEQGGGEVGGELEQRGGSGLAGPQAELSEPLGESEVADGPSGLAAGEQPWGASAVTDHRVALPGGDELEGELGERFGQDDRLGTQSEPDTVVAGLHGRG